MSKTSSAMKSLLSGAAILGASAGVAMASDCASLRGRAFGSASVVEADDMAASSMVRGSEAVARRGVEIRAPFCRVRGVIKPTPASNIGFEVWLPPTASWNGKYLGVGGGGFGGTISIVAMKPGLERGYAVASTDGGHIDTGAGGAGSDISWAAGHPEKVVDFAWRAAHETAVASKAIIIAYYRKPASRSYFMACSGGGRDAFVEAQRFPKDYQGIAVGAPGQYNSQLLSQRLWIIQEAGKSGLPPVWPPKAKLETLHKAVLATCGAVNGLLEDPQRCRFDPSALLCKTGESDACLTAAEVELVRKVYGGMADASGRLIVAGWSPGSELGWNWGAASRGFAHTTDYFRYMGFGDPKWDEHSVSAAGAYAKAQETIGPLVDAINPDLRAFKASGGKIIHYHGWADYEVPSAGSIKYYETVAAAMGGRKNLQSFYRLFMAPGMGHCGGGEGPNAVGGASGGPAPAADPGHDVLTALERWVENGAAPTRLIATQYRDSDPAKGVIAQRPWCAYPAIARYSGQGERSQASAYTCSKVKP